jgi:hypothetical protein
VPFVDPRVWRHQDWAELALNLPMTGGEGAGGPFVGGIAITSEVPSTRTWPGALVGRAD